MHGFHSRGPSANEAADAIIYASGPSGKYQLKRYVSMTGIRPAPDESPRYDRTEILADGAVHAIGILAALAGVAWLISHLPAQAGAKLTTSVWIYGFSLVCMLTASALYNAAAAGRLKAKLRRLDHAMIFVMIAGSYTPIALNRFPEFSGHLLLGLIWSLAFIGIMLKIIAPPRSDYLSVGLYVGMGWVALGFFPIMIASISQRALILLVMGGVVYSAGALIHAWGRVRFHNVIWHVMVLLGAALQFGAIAQMV